MIPIRTGVEYNHPDILYSPPLHAREIISAFNAAVTEQWPSFAPNPTLDIHILNSSLSDIPSTTKFDLVVSPANSYGRLDGAFDDAISRAFCPADDYDALTRAAQKILYELWRGFAPPGSFTLVPFPEEIEDVN
ncbi:uncharacterized protein CDV56_107294 [Aspergillus thermomutatus]|uniref:ADP-ribose 1''-phosphate phosphatase n=1 Tax=Aspergillus thermomutatus TaxID=41047 RepID=A0A397GW84_ASPTH|nr:uncharacterized protein CDV56_107294 [Aspergillus thermomutatus]RHZ54897.1 hypothetical protein CDV56_107294 [Aspergillus thermomutatus]